jgi:hypothetical protein
MKNMLLTVAETAALIETGAILSLAADPDLLASLPKGNWIGGSSVYFLTDTGGAMLRDRVFCTQFSDASDADIQVLSAQTLPNLAQGYAPNGATIVLIPAFSPAHEEFALGSQTYAGLFNQPLMGWIAGVHLDDVGRKAAQVFNGRTGQSHQAEAVAMYLTLPNTAQASIDIVNLFQPGASDSPSFQFETSGFGASTAKVNGQSVNLTQYIEENALDIRLPLVADYGGAMVNVAIRAVDATAGQVSFFAPVVAGVTYRQARPVADYAASFAQETQGAGAGEYACNCILNYVYGELEGKTTGAFTGPATFGEIAYMLLNQTLVRLDIQNAA